VLDPLLRPVKDRALRVILPLVRGWSPNHISILAMLAGIGSALLLLVSRVEWALGLWMVNRILDGLDGLVARESGRASDFGGYLDLVGDFLVYAAVPMGLVIGRGAVPTELLALVALLAAFYVNAASWIVLSALLEKRGSGAAVRGEVTSVTMPSALVGGSETIVFYTLFLILPHYLVQIFGLFVLLITLSVLQRLLWARRHLG